MITVFSYLKSLFIEFGIAGLSVLISSAFFVAIWTLLTMTTVSSYLKSLYIELVVAAVSVLISSVLLLSIGTFIGVDPLSSFIAPFINALHFAVAVFFAKLLFPQRLGFARPSLAFYVSLGEVSTVMASIHAFYSMGEKPLTRTNFEDAAFYALAIGLPTALVYFAVSKKCSRDVDSSKSSI